MSRNRDIRGFFAARSSPQPQPRAQSQSQRAPSSASSSQSQLYLPSSPQTPPKPTPTPLSRGDEIKGSDDDEDGDSDDSLESITAYFVQKAGPAAHQRTTSTPQAKRIASGIHRSPLTLQQQPKKHKFDLKSLISHSRQNDRADESAKRIEELIKEGDDDDDSVEGDVSGVEDNPGRLQEHARTLLPSDEEGAKGDKLVRAMKRTKVDGSRKRCYFFAREAPLFPPPRSPFPPKLAKPWNRLDNKLQRDQAFINGLPYTIAFKGIHLPDELFLWILDEVCAEKNAQLRVQYENLLSLSACSDHTARLVNDMQLYAMLERLGGPRYAREHSKFTVSPEVEDPFRGRDWTGLVTFLHLIKAIAPNLKTANTISATQLLLRMSLDPVVDVTVRNEHSAAVEALVSALPRPGPRWDTACEAISSYLYENISEPTLRVIPLKRIPPSTPQLIDLRRRIAAESLFRNPGMGRRPLDAVLTIEDIRDRLDERDLTITHSTDFEQLKAVVYLLDTVIGNAGFLRRRRGRHHHHGDGNDTTPTPATTTTNTRGPAISRSKSKSENQPKQPAPEAEPEAEVDTATADRIFNAEIDALTFRLKVVHDTINDSNAVSRKEAKAALEAVSKRLTYAVRTRPPPKTNIFDLFADGEGSGNGNGNGEDVNLPRQRDFMRKWAQRKAERSAEG